MPPDRLLAQHLQSLQSTTPTNVTRLLSTAAHLLATLTNPLNLSLLTHHLLVSPALWPSDNTSTTLHNPLNFISVFQTAASRITRYEREQRERKEAGLTQPAPPPGEATPGGHLTRDEWIRAVIKGADNRSPTSRHVLAFSGLLIGFCGEERQGLRGRLRSVVENALVRAVNMALDQIQDGAEHEAAHIALALNYSFELLSDLERSRITYDKLLPVLLASAFFSSEGFESAMFVEGINRDLAIYKGKTVWPHHSSSFLRVNKISQKPLVTTMGPLARLIAHTIANLHAPWLVQTAADDLLSFSRTLEEQWRQCNLSRIDAAQEKDRLDVQTYQEVLPLLRRILRNALFAITIILRGTLTRILNDPILASDEVAPQLAAQSLRTLHHLSFILTHHTTPTSFIQHTFVNLASIDILTAYPPAAAKFLTSILPTQHSDTTQILTYLNTAEHFTLALSPNDTRALILPIALAHLNPRSADGPPQQLDNQVFEAAHATLLSVFTAPQNAELVAEHLPFYTQQLFALFPHNINARQFRLAIKTLVSVASPPNELATREPDMAVTLMEVVRGHVLAPPARPTRTEEGESPAAVLLLSLIDSLSVVATGVLEEWLPIVGELLHSETVVMNEMDAQKCTGRFWEVVSREMDVERAEVCVRWWGGKGGREMVRSDDEGEAMMSGALNVGVSESKL